MEELTELLNKAQNSGVGLFGHWIGNFERKYYAKNHWRLIIETLGYTDEDYEIYDYTDRDICGKDGGFIKWLVDNEKIDLEKCGFDIKNYLSYNKRYDKGIVLAKNYDNDTFVVKEFYSPYEQLLMLLSIQDEPIEFLISILK